MEWIVSLNVVGASHFSGDSRVDEYFEIAALVTTNLAGAT
jgi:hypothetical protein